MMTTPQSALLKANERNTGSSRRLTSVAVIPARGGSKGIARKCARCVAGVPLLVRAVRTVLDATSVDRVIVSTDDAEFAEMARAAGADVPFLRPAALATDTARVTDAVSHLCCWLDEHENALPELLLLLQPTSPFVSSADVDGAFAQLTESADAVTSICESEVHPDWLRRIAPDGRIAPLPSNLESRQHTPRQEMSTVYRLNGALYWIRTEVFMASHSFLPPATCPYLMPRERSIDIDNAFDLTVANLLAESSLRSGRVANWNGRDGKGKTEEMGRELERR